jgi:putative Mg2+ transporter-C (MgtC) family protein
MNDFAIDSDAMVRLLAAIVFGAAIGAEREIDDQPAGLRTHISVALGASLFGVVSTLGFLEFEGPQRSTNIQFDVTRVASTVVTGIGFIGAGVIFRQGLTVRNLTTAASLWATAAVGLAAGVGDIGTAFGGTAAALIGLAVLRLPRDWIRARITKRDKEVEVMLAGGTEPDVVLAAIDDVPGLTVNSSAVQKRNGQYVLMVQVEADRRVSVDERLSAIARRPDVETLGPAGSVLIDAG